MLLAFSVLLSGVAIYYSLNIVSVRLQTEDVRLTSISLFTMNAQYVTECNVKSAT